MITKWTDHIQDQETKENFKREILGAKRVLDRMSTILKDVETSLEDKELSVKAFEVASWPYYQAYHNGYRKALRLVQQLIDLDNRERKSNE